MLSKLSKSAKLLIIWIAQAIIDNKQKPVMMTIEDFMQIGLSDFTVVNTLRELEEKKIIVRAKNKGKSYHYSLKPISAWNLP